MQDTTEGTSDDAAKARQLAEVARRLASLMHQVEVRRDLLAKANALEQEASELERQAVAAVGR
jgi:hypothetical protein